MSSCQKISRSLLLAVITLLGLAGSGLAAPQVSKCVVDGTLSYQSGPCPTDPVRRHPTVEELNAAEKKRRAAAAAAAASASVSAASASARSGASTSAAPVPAAPAPAAERELLPRLPAAEGFRCDGRQYCSQMKSCAEAKYFLAHCPGVHMDGDKNGIPCERQWCGS